MIEINKADLGELDVEVVPVQFSFSSKESCVLANPVPVQCQKYCTWMFLGWQYWQDSKSYK